MPLPFFLETRLRDEARRFNREDKAPRRTKTFTFAYEPDDDTFRFRLTFAKPKINRDELIETLERILSNVKQAAPADFETRRTITATRGEAQNAGTTSRGASKRGGRPTAQPG